MVREAIEAALRGDEADEHLLECSDQELTALQLACENLMRAIYTVRVAHNIHRWRENELDSDDIGGSLSLPVDKAE